MGLLGPVSPSYSLSGGSQWLEIRDCFKLLRMANPVQSNRPRYKVVFGKDAQDLQGKLNDPDFTPLGYAVTHLTFNSARAEYLVILEDEGIQDR